MSRKEKRYESGFPFHEAGDQAQEWLEVRSGIKWATLVLVQKGGSPGSHSLPYSDTSESTVVTLFSDLHWPPLVNSISNCPAMLAAVVGCCNLLLLSCCKAMTGLRRLSRLPCYQCYISCPPVLWQFFWFHSTCVELRDLSTGQSRNYLIIVMELAESLYWNTEKEQIHWLEKTVKTERQV